MSNRDVKEVRLSATEVHFTPQLLTSRRIELASKRLSFANYQSFMDRVLCGDEKENPDSSYKSLKAKRYLPFTDTDAYRFLKVATEAFVAVGCASLSDVQFETENGEADELLKRVGAEDPGDLDQIWKKYLAGLEVREKSERKGPDANGIIIEKRTIKYQEGMLLPYLALIKKKLPDWDVISVSSSKEEIQACYDIIQERLTNPCLMELIWSYWHEEGMLVQTMNAISRRFQNIRGPVETDPLAMLEIGYLRPLNNLLWGYLQDEQHRLSVVRRGYEYDHHYGMALQGKAVPELRPADSRSKFLEAFHNLLYLASVFYKQDDDTTVRADAFPVLNALKDVHMLLAEGAHNQFGDLPSTARVEMLMQQWLLARPEFRELLPSRESVAYPEPWMERVDAMKRLQGWTDTSVLHFSNLGVFGEQILLSIRFIEWNEINDPAAAMIWARFWRPTIQGYTYAYRAVTRVDLTAAVSSSQDVARRYAMPSVLLEQLESGNAIPLLPSEMPTTTSALQRFRERKAARRQN